jgi:hypothetical protein
MSVMALVVTDVGAQRSRAIATIRQATGQPFAAIVEAIKRQQPVVERELFYRDHDEVARMLRNLVSILPTAGVSFELYELPTGTRFSTIEEASSQRISVEVLQNILSGHEEGLREQQALVDRELEADHDRER